MFVVPQVYEVAAGCAFLIRSQKAAETAHDFNIGVMQWGTPFRKEHTAQEAAKDTRSMPSKSATLNFACEKTVHKIVTKAELIQFI